MHASVPHSVARWAKAGWLFGREGGKWSDIGLAYSRCLARMLVSVTHVFEGLVGPRTRADELCKLRRELLEQAGPGVASLAEEQGALRLRQLREQLVTGFDPVEACAHCVRPKSATWPGGHCCSAHTRALFTEDELAALRLSGTTPAQLKPPRTEQSGCAFRGPSGCSLEAAHRPSLCVRFVCRELQSELDQRADGPANAMLREELRIEFARFVEQRQQRLGAEQFGELEASFRGK